jgi:hypothetical protein
VTGTSGERVVAGVAVEVFGGGGGGDVLMVEGTVVKVHAHGGGSVHVVAGCGGVPCGRYGDNVRMVEGAVVELHAWWRWW